MGRLQIQWGSEMWTSLDFEWTKRGWVSKGPDFESENWKPNHVCYTQGFWNNMGMYILSLFSSLNASGLSYSDYLTNFFDQWFHLLAYLSKGLTDLKAFLRWKNGLIHLALSTCIRKLTTTELL